MSISRDVHSDIQTSAWFTYIRHAELPRRANGRMRRSSAIQRELRKADCAAGVLIEGPESMR